MLQYSLLFLLLVCITEVQTIGLTSSKKPESDSDSSWDYNKYILTIVSSLSAVGSVAIIVTYFLWTDLQTTSRKILVYISIGDFFTVFPTLVIYWDQQFSKDEFACQFQSFVTSSAVMWSFFWTSSLAIYLYVAVVKKNHELAENLMIIFHVVNWTVPLVLVGTAWSQKYLGYAGGKSTKGWCWITYNRTDDQNKREMSIMWMFVCGKLWEIISYFINGVLYFLITQNIKKEVSERFHLLSTHSVQVAEQGGRKLALVPVIFVVLRIWGTIRFFIMISSADPPEYVNKILGTLQILGDQSQGIANFILFCALTEKFKNNIGRICRYSKECSEHASLIPKTSSHRRKGGGTFSRHFPTV